MKYELTVHRMPALTDPMVRLILESPGLYTSTVVSSEEAKCHVADLVLLFKNQGYLEDATLHPIFDGV